MVLMNGNKDKFQDSNLFEIQGMLFEFFKSELSKKDLFIFFQMYIYRNKYDKFSYEKYTCFQEVIFKSDKSNFLRSVKKLIAAKWLIRNNHNEYELLYHAPF